MPDEAVAALADALLSQYGLLDGRPGEVSCSLTEAINAHKPAAASILEDLQSAGYVLVKEANR